MIDTLLIRSSSGSSLPSQTHFTSSLSSSKCHLSQVNATGVRRWRWHLCVHDVWCVLMSDAAWRLMLGEAYSNGKTEVRETITTKGEEGVKRGVEVGSTLLSSPTVGRGRCPSVMTERLRSGFAFITAVDCPDAHHKYMTRVAWHKMFQSVLKKKGGRVLCCFMEGFDLFDSLSFSACGSQICRKTWLVWAPPWHERTFSSSQLHKYV